MGYLIGESILIIFAISPNIFSKILRNRFINYIGKISYKLIFNTPSSINFKYTFNKRYFIPICLIFMIDVVGFFLISNLMYYYVEKPAIRIGRFLSKMIN